MRQLWLLGIFVGVVTTCLSAQAPVIREEPAVASLMTQFVEQNKLNPYIDGWRVQILSTTDRDRLESTRSSFKAKYPYLASTWEHNRPYYMLRVGAFATRLEAIQAKYYLRQDYPSATEMRDAKITPQEILGNGY